MEQGAAPSPIFWCNSYWKGSLRVTLYYGWSTYLFGLYIAICFFFIFLICTEFISQQRERLYNSLKHETKWCKYFFLFSIDRLSIFFCVFIKLYFLFIYSLNLFYFFFNYWNCKKKRLEIWRLFLFSFFFFAFFSLNINVVNCNICYGDGNSDNNKEKTFCFNLLICKKICVNGFLYIFNK